MYTDGIFAIAATLLVLNFAVPVVAANDNTDLLHELVKQWPKALIFLLSFGVITNYWRLHSAMFRGVRVIDHKTMVYNLVLVVTAAFVPYATNVAGTYPTLPAAAVMYSITLLIAAVAGRLMSSHLIASNAYQGEIPAAAREADKRITLAIVIRVIGLGFAFFWPVAAYATYWVVIIYYICVSGVDAYDTEAVERKV
jgi:uncharacterized membrane protein